MGDALLTVPEIAKYTNRSERSVWSDIYAGRLPFIRIGRSIRVDPGDLSAFLEQRRSGQVVREAAAS